MPARVEPRRWEVYNQLRKRGFSIKQASEEARISYATAKRYEGKLNAISPSRRHELAAERQVRGPVPYEELRDEAKLALEDFVFFQRRYLGRIATPWQAEAAYQVREWVDSPYKEFGVDNAPPGSGKSTTFCHDIPIWLTCRDRAIRGLIGSKAESQARRYVARIRRTLERTIPYRPPDELVAKGLAVDAEATLADDFGSFKPETRDSWSAEGFVVAQHGDVLIAEKEPTWSAFGMDSSFLGMRYDFVVWDDVVDKQTIRTAEAREKQQEWWDDIAEQRLDPGGLFLLQGQRMGAEDLYRYCLDKRVIPDDAEEVTDESPRKYHHIVFKAHYEDRCENKHGLDAPYYPEGCLLDPRRLPWRELRAAMANPRGNFAVIYQQEDTDPATVLVNPVWVSGGRDPKEGTDHVGCWDNDRDLCELPPGLAGDLISYVTVDPSPTKWWSIQWWVTRCTDGEAQERYLMDLERRYNMPADHLIDWNNATQSFGGLMEDWQARSNALHLPIRKWIVERNGAQRFLLQFEHVRRWQAKWKVDIVPHDTAANKADPDYGVKSVAGIWKYGLVRLPGKQKTKARFTSLKLVEEVTHWPEWSTDDCVMAHWFGEWHLPKMVPRSKPLPRLPRPSWLKHSDTFGINRREGAA